MGASVANQSLKYHVDICFVVDTTGSMGKLIQTVKNNILRFYPDLAQVAEDKGKAISQLRIKVIGFKNYQYDGANTMTVSNFYTLQNEAQMESEENELKSLVDSLEAVGGSGSHEQGFAENGIEALVLAMKSDWDMGGDKRRHIIVLFSDVAPVPIDVAKSLGGSNYPQEMPATLDEVTDLWEAEQGSVMNKASKRLCLFAPDDGETGSWSQIGNNWEEVVWFPTAAGDGLNDTDYKTILDAIMNSI